jgi:hypothetical protein
MRSLTLFSLATAVSAAVIRDTTALDPYNKDKLSTICSNANCLDLGSGSQMYCLNFGVPPGGSHPTGYWTAAGMACPSASTTAVPRSAAALEPYDKDKVASCNAAQCAEFGLPRQIFCLTFGVPPGGSHPTGYWVPFGMECQA